MADNDLTIHTAGADRALAGKDVSGVYHEDALNETMTAAGVPAYTSPTNPMPVTVDVGTLMQRIEMLELQLGRTNSGAGQMPPDQYGRTRVNMEVGPSAGVPISNVTATVLNVNFASTAANLAALELRNQIKVS